MISESVKNNSFTNNFLIILCFVTFSLIALDLVSDLAVEKNEIGSFIGILEESNSDIDLSFVILSDIKRPLLFNIPCIDQLQSDYTAISSVNDRGPPSF
ncbi:MAG: hypothetical protein ABI528_03125 [bacterium]